MVMYHEHFLRGVRALSERFDIHWIADEIATGCGRTGRFFAVEHADVWPDFLCLSKGLSGGALPLSVTLTRHSIFELFLSTDVKRAFMHSHSFSGNPLACAAALGMLAVVDTPLLFDNARKSDRIFERLQEVRDFPGVTGLRRRGMIFAVDVTDGPAVAREALKRDLWIRPLGNTVYLMPPFLMDDSVMDWLAETFVVSIKTA
jgi:adenosylmethionine-8-amino-7-oxononanoate aminotransferase